MVAILLGTGFEEMEALCLCDCLRRVGVEVKLISVEGLPVVTGAHGIAVAADGSLADLDAADVELVMLPGGMGGVRAISASRQALDLVQTIYDAGRYVAAICAAPTILAALHITDGRQATCFPGMEEEMADARMCMDAPVVQDGNVITSTAAGTAMEFALHLVSLLKGEDAARELKESLVYHCR